MVTMEQMAGWVINYCRRFETGYGTWTPEITAATPGTMSITYTTQTGVYRLRDDVVHYWLRVEVNAFTIGTASGTLRVTLPVAVSDRYGSIYRGACQTIEIDLAGTPVTVLFTPVAGQSYGQINVPVDDGSGSVLAIGGLAAGDIIVASGSYLKA